MKEFENVVGCPDTKYLGEICDMGDGMASVDLTPELRKAFKQLSQFRVKKSERRACFWNYGVCKDYLCASDGFRLMCIRIKGLEVFGNKTCVSAAIDGDQLVIELLDLGEDYPDVFGVIPQHNKWCAHVDNSILLGIIKEMESIGYFIKSKNKRRADGDNGKKIKLDIKGGNVSFFGRQIGWMEISDDFTVGLNVYYMKDMLTKGKVSWLCFDDGSPREGGRSFSKASDMPVSICTEYTIAALMLLCREGGWDDFASPEQFIETTKQVA